MDLPSFSLFMHELGMLLGLPDLTPDENRACELAIGEVVLCMEADEALETLTFYAPLISLPETPEPMLRQVLAANLFWGETGGATFALSEVTEQIVMQQRLPLGLLTLPLAFAQLEGFVTQCETWMARLNALQAPVERDLLPDSLNLLQRV